MRGQVHTLESIVAGLLLLSSVVFALQMTAVTPLSASTSSQHIENQQQASAEGILAAAVDRGALTRAVLFWNATGDTFVNTTSEVYYTNGAPPNDFGDILERQFGTRGIAYNVNVVYETDGGQIAEQQLIDQGAPSDNAIMSSRMLVVLDNTSLYSESGKQTDATVEDSYLTNDRSPDSPVYNVVRVELIAWRI